VSCDQLFWAGNVGSGSHDPAKTGKAQNQQMFSGCPRKRTYLPILELLPPLALGERRHRGVARRLVAVRRRAILMMSKEATSAC
jgi:hypothetical protein